MENIFKGLVEYTFFTANNKKHKSMAKKVAIVTFRFMNFGTVLQSLGLQEALHKIGLKDVEILDFPNEGGQSGKSAFIETMKEQVGAYGFLCFTRS